MTLISARALLVRVPASIAMLGLLALSVPTGALAAPVFQAQCIFVSDASTEQGGHDSVAVPLPVNGAWTASLPDGAAWIWGELLSDADAQTDKTEAFTKTFTMSGASSVSLDVAADNGYKVIVNGITVDDQTASPPVDNFSLVHHVPDVALNAALHTGSNTLEIDVTNSGAGHPEYTALSNPAGLLYRMVVHAEHCAVVPPTPPAPQAGHLTIMKHVMNESGGSALANAFNIHVMTTTGTPADVAGSPAAGSETGVSYDLAPGDYTVSEDPAAHYATSYSETCSGGHVHVSAGGSIDCTVVNTYVPPPTCTIVSDQSTQEAGHDSAVLSFIHSAWTHALDAIGAKWIWGEDGVVDPVGQTTEVFTKVVHVNGTPASAYVDFATDNGYQVRVNGTLIGSDEINTEHHYEATTTLNILPNLTPNADNTIEFTVKNLAQAGGTLATNPAGLVYAIHINDSTCTVPDPHQTVTVHATKIVCDNEADLPNLAGSSHGTDANTATSFLASHPSCHLEPDWQFEWGNQNAGDPGGSFVGPAPSGYTTSAPTDGNGSVTMSVPIANTSSIHLREVLKNGFIPFTYDPASTTPNGNPVSAEFSCAADGLNYDNFDFINSPQAGQTYYCVAYNAPKVSTVKMCKTDDTESHTPLSGWNLTLKGIHVEDVTVPTNSSSGINTAGVLSAGTSYLAEATGTWLNQNGVNPVDAEYSTTDNWATHMDGYIDPVTHHNYGPGILELEINHQDGNWGPYNSAHAYAQSFSQGASAPGNFRIFDGDTNTHTQNETWFADNLGNLSVSLFKGYAGKTGENGCVTFTNVPYGTYTAGESAQDGWTNISGLGRVTVDSPTETFTVVNHHTPDQGGGEPTHTNETIVVHQSDLDSTSPSPLVVLADGLNKWFFYNDTTDVVDNAQGSMVNGPATAPLGTGSAKMTDADATSRPDIATFQFSGTPLGKITSLAFSSYSHSGVAGPSESPYLVMNVDFTGSSGAFQKRLVYVPANNGSVPQDAWNANDTIAGGAGKWVYSGATWPAPIGGAGTTPHTWAEILAAYPNARLLPAGGFMGVRVGEPGPAGYTGNVDAFVIGIQTGSNIDTRTYDFEPTPVTPETPTPPPGGGGGASGISGGGGNGFFSFGKVLGASTSTPDACGPLLSDFLHAGWKNSPDQVKKLQSFLNTQLGLHMPLSGFFGPATYNAVKLFQKGQWENVLKPWFGYSGSGITGPNTPTGFVYQTTKWRVNNIWCPGSEDFPAALK